MEPSITKTFENGQNRVNNQDSQERSSNSSQGSPIQSLSNESESDQLSSQSSPVEAAIKTMKFRKHRGGKMKDLMKGKIDHDQFWEKNGVYFGGNLQDREEDEDSEDYQQSSSGRDQFDSDFNLTDSYPGKRGRKKGSKVKRGKSRGRGRGRPRKQKQSESEQQISERSQESKGKEQSLQRQRSREKDKLKKRKFVKTAGRPHDAFIILKAESQKPSKKNKKSKDQEKKKQEKKQSMKEKQSMA